MPYFPDLHSIQDVITTNYAGQRQYPTKGYPQTPKIDLFQTTQDKTVSLQSFFYAITVKESELFDYRFHDNFEIPTIVNQV